MTGATKASSYHHGDLRAAVIELVAAGETTLEELNRVTLHG